MTHIHAGSSKVKFDGIAFLSLTDTVGMGADGAGVVTALDPVGQTASVVGPS